MRASALAATLTTILCFALFTSRHHIHVLSEVAYSYTTWHSTPLNKHDYTSKNASSTAPDITPKILHQIYLTAVGTPEDPTTGASLTQARQSCRALHPHWRHNLWTNANATTFITTHYPSILPHYTSYAQTIQRTNILRYLLLHHYGGVYLDLDITCLAPLDGLLSLPFVSPAAFPVGVNNAFLLSKPGHRFWEGVIAGIGERDLWWGLPYVENM